MGKVLLWVINVRTVYYTFILQKGARLDGICIHMAYILVVVAYYLISCLLWGLIVVTVHEGKVLDLTILLQLLLWYWLRDLFTFPLILLLLSCNILQAWSLNICTRIYSFMSHQHGFIALCSEIGIISRVLVWVVIIHSVQKYLLVNVFFYVMHCDTSFLHFI